MTRKDRDRFEKYYWQGPGCWNWTGAKSSRQGYPPYGNFRLGESIKLAHRVAYLIEYGPFNETLDVLHKCDNTLCVNPKHLMLGTKSQNMYDMHQKDRHPNATDQKTVKEITQLYKSGGFSQQELADRFGVSNQAVSRFVNGLRRNY